MLSPRELIQTPRFLSPSRLVGIAALIGFLSGCMLMTAQDLTESFSKSFPSLLTQIANPEPVSKPEFWHDPSQTFQVAVMDNGVDYNHPLLRDRIAYDVEDGKIIGAGIDVLGNDRFAHPNKIKAEFFAFGGKLSNDGRIAEYLEDPIAKLDELNSQFMDLLEPRIKRETALAKTFWTKVSRKSFHILSAVKMLNMKDSLLKQHNTLKSMGAVYSPESKNNIPAAGRDFFNNSLSRKRLFFDTEWTLDPKDSLPVADPQYYAGIETFLKVVSEIYFIFNNQVQFEKIYMQPYATFKETSIAGSEGALYAEWFKYKFPELSDPGLFLVSGICNSLSDAEFKRVKEMNELEKERFFIEAISKSFEESDLFNQYVTGPRPNTTLRTKQKSQFSLRSSPKYKTWVHELTSERKLHLLLCDQNLETVKKLPHYEKYSNYVKRTETPYLDVMSSTVSHGSHVTGIVLAQDPMLSVLPVRVLTESRETNRKIDNQSKLKFRSEFTQWLNEPGITEGAIRYLNHKLDLGLKTSQEIMRLLDEVLPTFYEAQKLDLMFIDQVAQAIREIGKRKIKVANVSLGTSHDQYMSGANEPEAILESTIHNLVIEFWKHKLSKILRTEAPGTVFVIAAGNSGIWLDGFVKSALPCDLSSPLFAESASGRQPPNILCVASTNDKGEMSGFTNLPLTNIPLVFTRGQEVLSALNSEDCSGSDDAVKRKLGTRTLLNSSTLASRDFEDYVRTRKISSNLELGKNYINSQGTIMSRAISASLMHQCLTREPYTKGYMDGTSMASPAAAGTLARFAREKAVSLRKSAAELYLDSEFMPEKLIPEFLGALPEIGGISQVRGIKHIPNTRGIEALESRVNGIRN